MHPLIKQLIDELPDFRDANGSVTTDAATAAEADLKAATAKLEAAKAELAAAKAGLTPDQRENLKLYELSIFDKRKELEGLLAAIEADKAKVREIEVNIAEAQRQHGEIEASIASLRKGA
jgi:chromosome segregation ATPase